MGLVRTLPKKKSTPTGVLTKTAGKQFLKRLADTYYQSVIEDLCLGTINLVV